MNKILLRQPADQRATGITPDGLTYDIARFGTTIITVVGDQDDDVCLADEHEAIGEFMHLVEAVNVG